MAEKRLVFVVQEIGSEATIKKLAAVETEYKRVQEAIKEAKKSGNQKAFEALAVEQEKLKQTAAGLKNEIREQNKAFQDAKYPTDSLRSLQAQYSSLSTAIRNMSQAQRESVSGQDVIAKAKRLKDMINEQSMAFGDNSKNIGNYTQSIQRALENPIKFLKNAGIVGIIATIGVKLTQMGAAAVEAFGKTKEGAKKLEGVQLAFARLKAVGTEFLFGVIEKILPVIERVLPPITQAFAKVVAFISGSVAGIKAVASNIVNEVKILANSALIIVEKAKAFLGNNEAAENIKRLQAENDNLRAGIVDVGAAYEQAYNKQMANSQRAIQAAKVEAKEKKEQKTILEGLKKQEDELTKKIEDRLSKNQDVTKELEKLRDIQQKILTIETARDKALAQSNITKLTQQRDQLVKTLDGLTKGTNEYTKAAEKLLEVEAKLKEAEATLDPGRAKRAEDLKELKSVLDEAAQAIQDSGGIEFEGKLFEKAEKEYEKFVEAQKRKDADLAALKKKNQENVNTEYLRGEEEKALQEEAEAKAAAQKKKDIQGQLAQAAKETAMEAVNFGAQLINQGLEEERANLNRQTDYKLQALNDEYDKKKAFASGNNELLVRLEGERAKKEEKIKKDAAKKDREIAIKQALIQGAVAIVRTLGNLGFPAGLIASIPIAAATAFQIALIKSQKFDKGGFAQPNKIFTTALNKYVSSEALQRVTNSTSSISASNTSSLSTRATSTRVEAGFPFLQPVRNNIFTVGGHTGAGGGRDETGEPVAGVGVYHGGEYIAPRKQVLKYPGLFKVLDRERGGARVPDALNIFTGSRLKKMAQGGFTVPPLGTGLSQAIPFKDVNATFNDDQILYLAKTIAIQTARETASELGRSLDNVNRRKERDERLKSKLSA